MDPLSAVALASSLTGFLSTLALLAHLHKNVETTAHELERQLADFDVLSLLLKEIGQIVLSQGRPSEAVEAAMVTCAQRWHDFEHVMAVVRDLQPEMKRKDRKRSRRQMTRFLWLSIVNANKRQMAFQAFRDSVLLLRDMSNSIYTSQQIMMMREEVVSLQTDSVGNEVMEDSVQDWDPEMYRQETGLDLTDLAKSEPKVQTARPLLNTLLKYNFTFDGTIVLTRPTTLKYVPVRGFLDTGSDAFMISNNVLTRAGIGMDDMELVMNGHVLRGLEGTLFKPKFQISLTWHVNRHMNSRVDTFYVVNDDSFDILVPSSLVIAPRNVQSSGTPIRQAALILQLRKKSDAERELERTMHAQRLKEAQEAREKERQARRSNRLETIREREKAVALSDSASSQPGQST